MSKPKTLRIVPQSRILTADSVVLAEGKAVDVAADEAERFIAMGIAVEVLKEEVEAGDPVKVLPPPVDPLPEPTPKPEPIEVQVPAEGKKPK